ncbi:hypothetical protein AAHC03_09718 [Spirometra sp. Aus1]
MKSAESSITFSADIDNDIGGVGVEECSYAPSPATHLNNNASSSSRYGSEKHNLLTLSFTINHALILTSDSSLWEGGGDGGG